jgi:hypothetical protein
MLVHGKRLNSEFVDEEKRSMINNHILKIISGWSQFKDLFYLHALRGNLMNINELDYAYKIIVEDSLWKMKKFIVNK